MTQRFGSKLVLAAVLAAALFLSLGLVPSQAPTGSDTPTTDSVSPVDLLRVPCAHAELTQGEGGTLDYGNLSCSGKKRNC